MADVRMDMIMQIPDSGPALYGGESALLHSPPW